MQWKARIMPLCPALLRVMSGAVLLSAMLAISSPIFCYSWNSEVSAQPVDLRESAALICWSIWGNRNSLVWKKHITNSGILFCNATAAN
ncbi:hypothetical protein M5689_001249 [Euphorbia peplus]|nr:hypothetical protein M5689_001249 [Euphorbia peplus]